MSSATRASSFTAGYDINDLAGKVSYEEVVYLLWKGKLPNRRELDEFTHALASRTAVARCQ